MHQHGTPPPQPPRTPHSSIPQLVPKGVTEHDTLITVPRHRAPVSALASPTQVLGCTGPRSCPPLTVQALIGEGPSAERPPPPHCPGRPHDCAERRTMGPVQRPEEVCPPSPYTARSATPRSARLTYSPALVHANRQRSDWGRWGFRLHFSPTPPAPPRGSGHPVLYAAEALACHNLRSARPCALPQSFAEGGRGRGGRGRDPELS